MPTRRGAERVPKDLRIHMRMRIDKPRRNNVTFRVNYLAGIGAQPSDCTDPTTGNAHIAAKAR